MGLIMPQMLEDLAVVVDIVLLLLEHQEINIHQILHYSRHPHLDKEILVVIMDPLMLVLEVVVQELRDKMVDQQEQVQIPQAKVVMDFVQLLRDQITQ